MLKNCKFYFFPEGVYDIDAASRYRCIDVFFYFKKNNINCEFIKSPFETDPRNFFVVKKYFLTFLYLFKKYVSVLRIFLKHSDRNLQRVFFFQRGLVFGFTNYITILKKIFKFKIVFDIDDAINLLSNEKRVSNFIMMSDVVVAGSHYLHRYAKKFNNDVFLIPTSVDLRRYNRLKLCSVSEKVIIGWVGSTDGLKYLKIVENPLRRLSQRYPIEFSIIGPKKKKSLPDLGVKINYTVWNMKSEIEDLLNIDIGIMPLFRTDFELAKCAFKAIQYMALAIPAVCSNVGENNYLIKDGINGFLCGTERSWFLKLERLVKDIELRKKMGHLARKTIVERYSQENNFSKLLKILDNNIKI